MSTELSVEYLDEERKKLWERIQGIESRLCAVDELRTDIGRKCSAEDLKRLEIEFDQKLPDHEREAKTASKMISQYWNQSKQRAEDVNAVCGRIEGYDKQLSELVKDFQELQDNQKEAATLLEQVRQAIQSIDLQKTESEKLIASIRAAQSEAEEKLDELAKCGESWTEIEAETLTPAKTKIEALRENTAKDAAEIRKTYETIFGSAGLKDRLEKAFETLQKNFSVSQRDSKRELSESKAAVEELAKKATERYDNLLKEKEETYTHLKNRIESLLPKALTAGLAGAYEEKRINEEKEREKSQDTFKYAIWGMVALALIPVAFNAWLFMSQTKAMDEIITNFPFTVVLILPLYAPVLWLAYAANKRMNQSKRLIEEYAHKETLSKTFEGLSTQVKQLEESGLSRDLSIKLLYNIIKASSENPGELIKGFNKPDNPLLDVLEKTTSLSDSLTKLAEIPGMSWIAEKLKKAQQAKSEIAKAQMDKNVRKTLSSDDE